MLKKVNLTLLVYLVAIFAISTLVEAKGFDSVNRRDHENLKRIIKKRGAVANVANVVEGIGSEPSVTATAAGASISNSAAASSSSASSATTNSGTSASLSSSSASSSSSSSASSSSTGSSSSTSATSTSSSSSASSSSSIATATSASSTSAAAAASAAVQTSQAATDGSSVVTTVVSGGSPVTLTRSVSAATASTTNEASVSGGVTTSSKSIGVTVVIAIAASVGGIVILWTIFRKWKLGRSAKFDQRLQPINWQPTPEEPGIVTHRRRMSDSSSFHSGIHGGGSDMGHGSSDHGHSYANAYGATDLPPLPTHDFTAGSHLAPVGGYADLARGPSPQPQMQEALARGPSIHQTGYGAGY